MAKFNPDFWEVTISPDGWRAFTTEDHLYFEDAADVAARQRRTDDAESLCPAVLCIMEQTLTPRQREVVLLYFFRALNQRQISEKLGITQQAVSECLYGRLRNGKAVGGALRKLGKECAKRGITYRPI